MPFGKASVEPTFTIDLIENSDIALFHWKGPITLEDRQKNLQRMVEFCRTKGVRKILIDGRDQESETSVLESFSFGSEVPRAFSGLNAAVVHRGDDDSLKFIRCCAMPIRQS